MAQFDGKTYDCPFDCFLAVLKGKWRTDLLLALADHPSHFRELQRTLTGISAKVLTENLRGLERNHLVERQEQDDPAGMVEYHLSSEGEQLIQVMEQINHWVGRWLA
ncbi:helix-turn-helix domain-containing protein [uncultured Acidaminococcus sp.]|uniref:winged helix-turn-helix transcriptional regulator n=1 Tax=uncultured Acidaminococcus sp. TaxID=352152 RepID=UPI0026DAD212|nr:helix-turn-helix domain-containing protein [uncultured Acidaminococcus sp.]